MTDRVLTSSFDLCYCLPVGTHAGNFPDVYGYKNYRQAGMHQGRLPSTSAPTPTCGAVILLGGAIDDDV